MGFVFDTTVDASTSSDALIKYREQNTQPPDPNTI